jgi:hypothetical protein
VARSVIVVQTNRIRALSRLLALTAVLLVPAGTAAAATPFTLPGGAGAEKPSIAVDESGVGHFAWNQDVPYVSSENPGHDIVHYCQIPRNGTGCAKTKAITLPHDDFTGPRVLLHPNGTILLVSQRCCGSAPGVDSLDILWVVGSGDGGTTWSQPKAIGTVEPSGDALLGPGEFSISVISSIVTGGTFFQAAPLSGFTKEAANVGDRGQGVNNPYADGGIAYLDPLTPITAMSDGDNVYARKWGGAGDYNDLATWGPIQHVAAGDTPRIVGGKKGVYLAYQGNDFRFRVARWGGMAFGSPAFLTPSGDSPYEPDLFEDKSGGLHFVWRNNNTEQIHMRESKDGVTWGPVKSLTPGTGSYFGLETATARDGGGWVVWDQNSSGPIRAVQYGPTGPVTDPGGTDADCPEELDVGGATIVAREKCLKKIKGTSRYETNGDIRVNGIDLYTNVAGAGSAKTAANATITIDKSAGTLQTKGKVEARVGNVVLDKASLEWKIPQKGGQILDLAGNPAVFETGKFKIEFLGLPVSGETSPKIKSDGSVEIPVHLGMPKPFAGFGGLGDITGDIVLTANVGQGLKLSSLTIKAKNVGLGIATIKELVIEYVGDPSRLYGKAELLLPVIQSALETEFQLKGGKFDYGKAKLTFPGQGIPVASAVYLKAISFGVATNPTMISGGAQINGMGQIGSTPVLAVLGTASYTFPDAPKPGVFRIEGNGKLVGINFFSVFGQYETSGKISFGGDVKLGNTSTLGIYGGAQGAFDTSTLRFDLLGEAGVCAFSICGGAKMLISNIAVAGCLGGDAVGVGAAYVWGEGLEGFWSCDLGAYKAIPSARIAQSGIQTVKVKGGQPLASIMVRGQGAPPRLTVTGPGGQTISSNPDQSKASMSDVGVVISDVATQSTIVNLQKPQAGDWRIAVQPGSPGIDRVSTANALPEPSVRAVVGGRGHDRTLTWKIRQIPGQRVRIVENGAGAYNQLVAPKTATGTVRFTPTRGKAGKRKLFAMVEQYGMPRERVLAGTYVAPGPPRPSAPRFVKLRRRGGNLVVTWGRSRGAASYAVRAALEDGRRLVIPTNKRKHVIAKVPGIDSGKISVFGIAKDKITFGPARKAGFKSQPKRRKRRR